MKRRESVLWLAAIGIGAVIPHAASQQAKSRRIGILLPNPSPSLEGAFRKRLALRDQVVAAMATANGDDVADVPKIFDIFDEDDLHSHRITPS